MSAARDPRIQALNDRDELPLLPDWVWRRTARFSLRRQITSLLDVPTSQRLHLPSTAVGALLTFVGLPLALAFLLGSADLAPSAVLDRAQVGTLWQVLGAVVGFAIALAIYGYQAMGRTGPVETEDIAQFLIPATVVFGICLVLLAGITFVITPEPGPAPTSLQAWLGLISFVLSGGWAILLLFALPEAIRVADPNVRTRLRLARLRGLAIQSAFRRIVELASINTLETMLASRGAHWSNWRPLDNPSTDRRITSRRDGYVADIHLGRVARFASRNPGVTVYVALDSRLSDGLDLLHTAAPVAIGTRPLVTSAVVLETRNYGEPLARLIESLRDDARRAIVAQPGTLKDVLDGYAAALKGYAETWHAQVGSLQSGHLSGPLTLDTTPFGLIVDAVKDLAEAAVSTGGGEALADLGYFPGRIARIGLEQGTSAYLAALRLYPILYEFGNRNSSSPGAAYARGSWFYLAEFFALIVPSLRHGPHPVAPALRAEGDRQSRTWIIRLGRLMILRGDLESFIGLMDRVNAKREDDDE